MFTGIIEDIGIVKNIVSDQSNLFLEIKCSFASELKVDQSISHNGVCLTVIKINGDHYSVTVIDETLKKSNLSLLKSGDAVNLERSMMPTTRLDGHIVQGHVDQTAVCTNIIDDTGSWKFYFKYKNSENNLTVKKGSICVNGVSLTVVDSEPEEFSVAIIPYTFEHTNFKYIQKGTVVNLEFDILGKYVQEYLKRQNLIKI